MEEIEIDPCPFNHSPWKKDKGRQIMHEQLGTINIYQVYCLDCCAKGPVAGKPEEAIKKWNTAVRHKARY